MVGFTGGEHLMFIAQQRKSGRTIELRAQLSALAPDAVRAPAHIATFGKWAGHGSGEFEFTREVFEQIIANFERQQNAVPFVIGHPDFSAEAEGWIHGLSIVGDGSGESDGLWADVEWLPDVAPKIGSKWRFCSGVFVFDSIDRVTGEPIGVEMPEVGLTNTPFIDGQTPLSLSRPINGAWRLNRMDPEKMIAAVAKALGVDPKTKKEEVIAMLDAIYSFLGAMENKSVSDVKDAMAKDAELSRKAVAIASNVRSLARAVKLEGEAANPESQAAASAILTKLMSATGMDEAALLAAIETNLDAVAAVLTGQPASGGAQDAGSAAMLSRTRTQLEASSARVKALELTNEALQKRVDEIETKEIGEQVDALIAGGHYLGGDREVLIKLARSDRESFNALALSAKSRRVVPTGRLTKPAVPEGAKVEAKTPAEKKTVEKMKALGLSEATIGIALELDRKKKGI